jgi:hypothetical protein
LYIIVDYSNIGEVFSTLFSFARFVALFMVLSVSQLWRPSLLILHRFLLDQDGIFLNSLKNYLRFLVEEFGSFATSLWWPFSIVIVATCCIGAPARSIFIFVSEHTHWLCLARSEHDLEKGILVQHWT